jgi:anti-anti-sigma factor
MQSKNALYLLINTRHFFICQYNNEIVKKERNFEKFIEIYIKEIFHKNGGERMKITEKKNDDEIILTVEGRLDCISATDFQEAVILAFNKYVNVKVDFEKLTYIGSSGFRTLLMAQRTAYGRKGSFTIFNVSEPIMKVFNMTGFTGSFNVNSAG